LKKLAIITVAIAGTLVPRITQAQLQEMHQKILGMD
jgi:hypothetical protein